MMRDRNARTLNLRRTNRPSLGNLRAPRKSSLFEQLNRIAITEEEACKALSSQNPDQLCEFCDAVIQTSSSNKQTITSLATSKRVGDALLEILGGQYEERILIKVMGTVAALFPMLNASMQDMFVDDGLVEVVANLLESPADAVSKSAADLLGILSDYSCYARNYVLTFGKYDDLIRVAASGRHIEISKSCCEALRKIFSDRFKIDTSENLKQYFSQIAPLLNIPLPECVRSVLFALYGLTNHYKCLVANLKEIGMYEQIPQLISREEFCEPALLLLCNMAAQTTVTSHIQSMFEAGLWPALLALVQTEYLSTVLCAIAHLLESAPDIVFPLIDESFVDCIISVIETSSIDTKAEGAGFLSTVISRIDPTALPKFVHPDLIDVFTDMLESGRERIVLKSIEALMTLVTKLVHEGVPKEIQDTLLGFIQDSDVISRLDQLLEEDAEGGSARGQALIPEKASSLMTFLERAGISQ